MIDFANITFAQPYWFALLVFLPWFIYWQHKKQARGLRVSIFNASQNPSNWRTQWQPKLIILRYLAYLLFIIALARPQQINQWQSIRSEGIDIVLSMDISGSMLAEDFQPNRLEAAKKLAEEFTEQRIGDRLALVVFSGESFSQCPLTTDRRVMKEQLQQLRSGLLEDGTAIGMGLATAVDRLRQQKTKSKIIILLTDGVNNAGLIDPITALDVAKAYGIKVYTIGIGTQGEAPIPVTDEFGQTQMRSMPVQIDETLLQKIATETGGRYFRATSNETLRNVYSEIDRLEKTPLDINSYRQHRELFHPWLTAALLLILLEFMLRQTIFRSFI